MIENTIVCARCISDSSMPAINFDENGICNYCRQYDEMNKFYPTGMEGKVQLQKMVDEMKLAGKGKPYDVVIGVSGGCDSSFMLHLAKEYGLRPLAAHFDNTWNSKIAVENIQTLLNKLNIDLYTIVVDNNEYNDVFKSFLRASVPECDAPTDLALAVTHYKAAEKFGIKYIWEGHSFRTEGITPPGWVYMDAKYVQGIQKRFGTLQIKTLPMLWLRKWFKWMLVSKIKKLRPLYYLDYNKEITKKFLEDTYNWQWYGGHHMENRTAYFANNYYLPVKFGIDLRVCEYSGLIRSGQLTKEEALKRITTPKPHDQSILDEIYTRLNLTEKEFEQIMAAPPKTFRDFPTYKKTFIRLRPLFWFLLKANYITKSFYDKFTVKN